MNNDEQAICIECRHEAHEPGECEGNGRQACECGLQPADCLRIEVAPDAIPVLGWVN